MRSGLPCVMRVQIWSYCFIFVCSAKSLQSCPTLWDPMNCSPPGSSVMGFSRQEYWRGLPCPPPEDLPDSGMDPMSLRHLHLQAGSLPWVPPVKIIIFVWEFVKCYESSVLAVSEVSRLRHGELIPSINKHYFKNTYEMRSLGSR